MVNSLVYLVASQRFLFESKMCHKGADRYVNTYISKARENVPCNWVVIALFFVFFTLLDHIRGLGTLIGLLVLLPLHCNKRASDDSRQATSAPQNQPLLVLCTEQPGVHRSCTALYFWCAANGITESLALTLHGPVEKVFPAIIQTILVFILWGTTLLISALLIDSLTVSTALQSQPSVDIESPQQSRHASIARSPI